ncbi:leucine-rich repeat and WD repeat-containing protein 1-like [Rhopalosiphum maidis]|uniref:leucine-rich repeat and WD repeat-containing protein 1-like n=1 Tax=Rhopalosiphum maidis TaxID=43146 RepID=UPI000F00D3D6|nr:leucine-rich repeat and WD repeat-containing protein 1-like [Rhopalosiphum maidis]
MSKCEFVVHHFLRCHSRTDNDSADVSTQVWYAAFDPSKKSYLVATCGGNKVCVIDVKTGVVQYRYTYVKGLLYTLSWSTACPGNKILATGGTNNTIVFIDLSTNSAYLHYILPIMNNKKVFISSILFHPSQNVLFCTLNNGYLFIFEFEIYDSRIVNIEEQCSIDLKCEIFGLAFCEINDYLLIATNVGLKGWDNSQSQDQELVDFELPKNPNELYKDQNENVIDSIEIVKDSWIAIKVALHGVIYIFNLDEALSKTKNNKCVIIPPYILKWSDTDNYFMSCSVGLDGKLLACGDDKGSVWIYNLKDISFKSTTSDSKIITVNSVLKWPKLHDSYLKKKKKLEVDVYDIVMAKCAVHCSGNYLVAVTNNNFVCLYKKPTIKN